MLLHVTSAEAWEAARAAGVYAIPDGDFIHLCFPDQLAGVLERFYPEPRDGLVVLSVDPAGLDVVVEAADDGAGDFPHLYEALPPASVVSVTHLAEFVTPS